MGESPERRGSPSEVDLARGPAVRVAGTQGGKRGGVQRGPLRTAGTRRRVLRGGKGGCRAFGRRLQERGEASGGATHEVFGERPGSWARGEKAGRGFAEPWA